MKRIVVIAIGLLASFAAAGSASAQDHQAKANIPFNFYVGNTWLPAGTYTVSSSAADRDIIKVLSEDKTKYVAVMSLSDETRADQGELVFRRVGDQYFLHEILCTAGGMNVEFPASRTEKTAQIREASVGQASNVYLALLDTKR